jgi:hypothetical protein
MPTSTINQSETQHDAAEQHQGSSQALFLYTQRVALPVDESQTQVDATEQPQTTSRALDFYAKGVALSVDESQTQVDTTEQDNATIQALVLSTLAAALPVIEDQKLPKTLSAASKVFNITELAEMILLKTDIKTLHTTAPQIFKDLQLTILGSIKLQRDLHKSPDWSQTKMSPAPLPTNFLTYKAQGSRADGTFDYDNAPAIEPDYKHHSCVRFGRDAVAWACNPDRNANAAFRDMLVCQPPAVAVEILCWSTLTADYKPKLEQHRVENEDGVTCGQVFDLAELSSPTGGNARLTWFFSDESDRKA